MTTDDRIRAARTAYDLACTPEQYERAGRELSAAEEELLGAPLTSYERWMVKSNLRAIAAGVTTGADNVATLHANGYHRVAASVAAELEQPNPLEEYGASVRADDETPAEELGRLRRELSELDHETPEYRDTLDRISVLVREAAERRREERHAPPTVAETIGADLERHNAARELAGAVLEHEGTDSPPEWEQVYALAHAVLSL